MIYIGMISLIIFVEILNKNKLEEFPCKKQH